MTLKTRWTRRFTDLVASRTGRFLACLLIATALAACAKAQVIKQDPNRAAEDAAAVLTLIYFHQDYEAAYAAFDSRVRERITFEDFSAGVDRETAALGAMLELSAEGYKPLQSERAMLLFFTGTRERGTSYHKLLMAGDSGGYKIAYVGSASAPFSDSTGMTGFDPPLVVTR